MLSLKFLSGLLVAMGAFFMLLAIIQGQRIRRLVPTSVQKKWLVLTWMMVCFFAGYALFIAILVADLNLPLELVSGSVFLGGALFVTLVVHLTRSTVYRLLKAENALRAMNESLEQRVEERTHELLRSHRFAETVMNSLFDEILIVDAKNYQIVAANKAFLEHYGCSRDDVVGKTCFGVTHNRESVCEPPHDICPLLETVRTGREGIAEHLHFVKDGQRLFMEITTSPILGEDGMIEQVVHVSRDITERKLTEEKILTLAYYDNLTKLPNRISFNESLKRVVQASQRYDRLSALMFVDLDNFKRINDTFGHRVGDLLLIEVARRLNSCVRKSDTVARQSLDGLEDLSGCVSRLGGDEFTILLTEMQHAEDAAKVAQRAISALSLPFVLDGHEIFTGASIGIAVHPQDGVTAEELIKNADAAMYHAKAQGKGNFEYYGASLNASAVRKLTLENELRRALDRDQMLLHYQPIVDRETRKVLAVEALLRWIHPEMGMISPGEFISLAEESGLIIPIRDWALHTACAALAQWRKGGVEGVKVSVNVAEHQFKKSDIIKTVQSALDSAALAPALLALEIREGLLAAESDAIRKILDRLREMGISLTLDHFGTGYTSARGLSRLPLSAVKISRSFLQEWSAGQESPEIVKGLAAMARSLSLEVILDGVDDERELHFADQLACSAFQGIVFCPPLPAEDLGLFLTRSPLVVNTLPMT